MIARFRRWLDARRNRHCTVTPEQWHLMAVNMAYRERHYWQINRGNG